MNANASSVRRPPIPGVKRVVAVASGKGGVGKSTTSANLAVALARQRRRVGLMDADIYGPNVPIMMGLKTRPDMSETGELRPLERHGVKFISLGLIAGDGMPVIWRGPMLAKMVTQFLRGVLWAPLDDLLVDLPPGTGDVQLTLTQEAPLDGAVIVTTPQDVALEDVRRGVQMFRTVDVPVLGVIENMSGYACRKCGKTTDIFGRGGGARVAERFGLPLLGEVPMDIDIRSCADSGTPVTLAKPDSAPARAYTAIASRLSEALDGSAWR